MPPDQETSQNTDTPDSSPTSPSAPIESPSEAPEAPQGDSSAESSNIPVDTRDNEETVPEDIGQNTENKGSLGSQPETPQIPVNEPLESKSKPSLARELLIQARNAIQFRKRKKLDKLMSLFLKHQKITNDEVEKFLHVSDATATRYLSQLEREGKIKQIGKTGHSVSYSQL